MSETDTSALHPDDPPVAKMNGVAKLFTHYEGYRRAEKIAGGSKHWAPGQPNQGNRPRNK